MSATFTVKKSEWTWNVERNGVHVANIAQYDAFGGRWYIDPRRCSYIPPGGGFASLDDAVDHFKQTMQEPT